MKPKKIIQMESKRPMDEEIKSMMRQVIEGQKGYIKALDNQGQLTSSVLAEVGEVKKSVERLHKRLDTTSEKATINEQSIIHIEKAFEKEQEETEKKFDIVHESIRRRDMHLRWVLTSIIIPIAISLFAFFKSG